MALSLNQETKGSRATASNGVIVNFHQGLSHNLFQRCIFCLFAVYRDKVGLE